MDNVTLNTVMQKALILSIEWDKRINRLLYFGTQTALIKQYDITQKKIIQEVAFNKQFPVITHICSSPSSGKYIKTI